MPFDRCCAREAVTGLDRPIRPRPPAREEPASPLDLRAGTASAASRFRCAMWNGNVVEFPTGRRLPCRAGSRQTVAALAKRLAVGARIGPRAGFEHEPLPVDLRDLTGVSDRTVDTLSALAEGRFLTPASAARLAMRHAREIGHSSDGPVGTSEASPYSHRLVLAGDVFGRFAIRIENRTDEAWIGYAALTDLDLLSEVCPAGGDALCLVPAPGTKWRPTVALRKPRDWRADLARLSAGTDRVAERFVLVVGGLAGSGRSRAAAIAGIEDGLRRGGMRVRSARCSARSAIATAAERERQSRPHLVLIEIACPGLVDVLGGVP